jgi:hypothetical protein
MAGRSTYTPLQVQKALAMVRAGHTRAQAARVTGMTIGAVRHAAVTAGIVSARSAYGHRVAFRPGARPFTDAEDAAIQDLLGRGKGYSDIGTVLGRSGSSIRSRLLTLDQIARREAQEHAQ